MMKAFSKILCGFLLFISLNNQLLFSQIRTFNLPEPSRLLNGEKGGLLGGANDVGSIYYGAVPANSSTKPVLVFIHGYNSNAKTWWENNNMYNKAFADGYRTAFVSVHPNQSYYTNGQLFRDMLNTICQQYGVQRVNVIAHSKGGVDSDAATALYGALNRVQRVITLGSPHFGTPLADLAQSGWVSWLTTPIGQNNAGTQSLQTGAMSNFRNQIANNPNGRTVVFRTFGSWGYSGSLWVSGVYLSWNGGGSSNGGNDGVVNYSSTRRPNSAVIFGTNDSRGNLNHFEIADGDKMWNHIKLQLSTSATAASRGTSEEVTPENYNPNALITTQSQIISADKGSANFYIHQQSKKVRIEIYQNDITTPIILKSQDKNNSNIAQDWQIADNKQDNVLGEKIKVLVTNHLTEGLYALHSEKPFVALIYSEDNIIATLSSDLNDKKLVYNSGEDMNFKISLNENSLLSQATATGMLVRVSNLEGEKSQQTIAERLNFALSQEGLNSQIKGNLPEGIYNLSIEIKGANFTKSMVTSIAIVGKTNSNIFENEKISNITTYPNPATEKVTFRVNILEKGNNFLKVYDNNGRESFEYNLSDLEKGTHEVTWDLNNNVKSGLYFCEFNSNGKKEIQKLIINK